MYIYIRAFDADFGLIICMLTPLYLDVSLELASIVLCMFSRYLRRLSIDIKFKVFFNHNHTSLIILRVLISESFFHQNSSSSSSSCSSSFSFFLSSTSIYELLCRAHVILTHILASNHIHAHTHTHFPRRRLMSLRLSSS